MAPRSVRPAAALVALALGMGGLSACGLGGDRPAPTVTATSTADALPPMETEDGPSPTTTAGGAKTLPSGTRWATSSRSGLRWAVPDDFTVVDVAALRANRSTPVPKDVRALARRQGMSVNEMLASFGTGAELVAVDTASPQGQPVTANVNLVAIENQSLPDEQEIRRQLENIPGSRTRVLSVKDVPMELGPANRTVYTMTVKDRTLAVEAMAVEHDGGTATITASAATARAAKALMDDIVDTLEPVAASASASSSSAASSASSRAA